MKKNSKKDLFPVVLFEMLNFGKKWPISLQHLAILELASKNKGSLIQDLHKDLPFSMATMSGHVNDLREMGYLEKSAPTRGRGYVISVTQKGSDLMEEVRSHFAAYLK